MLSPAGDAHHPGRIIEGGYERGLTIQLAEQLKNGIEQQFPNVRVLIARSAGQRAESLEHANIANRLAIDLYLTLMIYQQKETTPQLALYTYAISPTDKLKTAAAQTIQFIPFDQAHIAYQQTTIRWAQMLLDQLHNTPLFSIPGNQVYAIPLKSLAGINAPQIGIELSMQDTSDIDKYVPSLLKALGTIIAPLEGTL